MTEGKGGVFEVGLPNFSDHLAVLFLEVLGKVPYHGPSTPGRQPIPSLPASLTGGTPQHQAGPV